MINAREKEFWFRILCRRLFDLWDAMHYGEASPGDLDTSRIAAYREAENKLVGFCIPFQYNVDINCKDNIIRILSHNDRVLRKYTRETDLIDPM